MADEQDNSRPFRSMATRIDINKDEGFSGAFVIVPPEGAPIEVLVLNSKPDSAMFYSVAKARIEIAIQELANAESQNQWGRR